ncbi:MAG: FAD-dependent oxidoreductase [Planctomycetota bacterium]|jgi:hypothetical protein
MNNSFDRREFLKAAPFAAAGAMATAECAEAGDSANGPNFGMITEPARRTPVVYECDICVIGGSCTGVFAAVAAARLGARVALVEMNGFFGGVATASLVNKWHSLKDRSRKKQIIGGMTEEMIERLKRRDAVLGGYDLSTEMLKLELDKMVVEAKVRPFLHTMFVAPAVENGRVTAAIIEDKSGRRAIRARQFVDASGDADMVARMGLEVYKREHLQPPTMCCILRGLKAIGKANPGFNIHKVIFDKKYKQALREGYAWSAQVPAECGCPKEGAVPAGDDHRMLAGTRVFGADCSDADRLTQAELDGRRQVDAICRLLREHFTGGRGVPLVALPTKIGIRETRHVRCLHELKADELITGKRFDDAIANGTYRIDVHSAQGAGVKFRSLNAGTMFYQIPYRSLVPRGAKNVLVAGRSIDADEQAFGAVRVMVNCNQMGQAIGVASWVALDSGTDVGAIDTAKMRAILKKQGAAVI